MLGVPLITKSPYVVEITSTQLLDASRSFQTLGYSFILQRQHFIKRKYSTPWEMYVKFELKLPDVVWHHVIITNPKTPYYLTIYDHHYITVKCVIRTFK